MARLPGSGQGHGSGTRRKQICHERRRCGRPRHSVRASWWENRASRFDNGSSRGTRVRLLRVHQ